MNMMGLDTVYFSDLAQTQQSGQRNVGIFARKLYIDCRDLTQRGRRETVGEWASGYRKVLKMITNIL